MKLFVLYEIFHMKNLKATITLAFALVLLLAPVIPLHAANSYITGKVINGQGFIIRLMAYSDQVTYQRVTLKSDTIHQDESFSMSVDIDSVLYCWLDLEFQQADLFIQPGQNYEVELDLKNRSLSTSYYNRSALPVKFLNDDEDHLNLSIQDFNQLYNDFLLNYSENVGSQKPSTAYATFIRAIELRFQNNNHPYFKNYIRYKTAAMLLFMRLKSREAIGMEYFTGQPVLYTHVEYMDFFHLYFEKYFITGGKYFSYTKTNELINEDFSLDNILDSLAADPVLKDVAVRELMLLDGLKELYTIAGFNKSRVISLIQDMAASGSFPESRAIAANLVVRLNRLQPGSPAPVFAMEGISKPGEYRLSDFREKYVYLAFFDSANPASQSELGLASDFYEEYKDKVAFVAVSVDKDKESLTEYISRAGLPWLVLHFGGNLELLENYDANTFPHFVLISDKGNIVRCPAPSPSENIQKLLDSF
jgi:peroxiredoxin